MPAIRGSAWITGVTELYVDAGDPFPEGFLLSDTWPGDDVQQERLLEDVHGSRGGQQHRDRRRRRLARASGAWRGVLSGIASVGLNAIEFVNET